ncbi:MAG: alpha/beta fold hydrolase [Pseudomonadota bacterium]
MRINHSALALFLLACIGTSPLAAQEFDHLDSCELTGMGGLSVTARCGTLVVPEDPDQPDGRELELAYAIVPARAGSPAPDPVFFLAGGPGQSAIDIAPMMSAALRDTNRDRHLVFLEQRGTGTSHPLNCTFDDMDDMLELDFERINEAVRECMDDWDVDVRHFTSNDYARDLERLRAQYGFEQINLIGGSYGTRMAQVYLRAYPERVRSVVLDAVVPTRLRLGSEHSLVLDETLELLFDHCEADEACNTQFPDIKVAFRDLIGQYRDSGQSITISHPRTGEGTPIEFNDQTLGSALRFLSYSPQTQMIIPYLVHEAATTGSPDRIAAQALIVTDQITSQIAFGLNFAVGCTEDWPTWPNDIDNAGTLLGDQFIEMYSNVCEWWPAGDTPPDFHAPFDVDTPILILSGELDPVTPEKYGDETAEQFSNSLHLVGQGLGHTVSSHPCFSGIIRQFFESASVEELDTECTATLGNAPFFVDLLGPQP